MTRQKDMENQVSLKQISERLGIVIGQLHNVADIQQRCAVTGLQFESVKWILISNGMLTDLVCRSTLPF